MAPVLACAPHSLCPSLYRGTLHRWPSALEDLGPWQLARHQRPLLEDFSYHYLAMKGVGPLKMSALQW